MIPEPVTAKAPSLATQVSRAVIWNTIFVPLKMLLVLLATLLKLTMLTKASYGMLTLIGAANNLFGTWIDLGTGRALPKFIPETLQTAGPKAMRRLVFLVLGLQMALLAVVALGSIVLRESYLGYLRVQAAKVEDAGAREHLLLFIDQRGPLIILAVLVMLVTSVLAVQAVVAQKAAERRQKQAEALVDFMLGDLNDKLSEVGRLDILSAVNDKAMAYFKSLPNTDVTAAVLQQRAKALVKIGVVRSDQGELSKAMESFEAASVVCQVAAA